MNPTYPGLQWLDWVVIALYALFMLGIGWFYARRQTDTEEYFVGGRRMLSFPVGLSLFATLMSTITYLAQPGETIKHGPALLAGGLYVPIVFVVVGYLFIPKFMSLRITSAYEILENRLGLPTRLVGSTIFLLTRLVWMALLIYLMARAMVMVVGMDEKWVPAIVIATGLTTVAYTGAGGMRAVVASDVAQFFVLMGGAVVTVLIVTLKMGGVAEWFPTEWVSTWDRQPVFSLNPTVRATMVGSIANAATWWICTAVADQMAIQRYASTPDARSARRVLLTSNIADVTVLVVLSLVGFALLGFFQHQPTAAEQDPDYLFPYFIANYVPMGVAGLIVAGMFAAAMSSLSSGINSTVTVLSIDFIQRLSPQRRTEMPVEIGSHGGSEAGAGGSTPVLSYEPAPPAGQPTVRSARLLAFGIGVAVVLCSALMGKVPGNIMEVTNKTNGLFVAPLAGLFLMALFVPFATGFAAIWGSIYGLLAAGVFAYWDQLSGRQGLSFQWILVVSLIADLIAGILLSLVPSNLLRGAGGLVFWNLIAALPIVLAALWLSL